MEKTHLGCRVYSIAKQYGVEIAMVHRIITGYLEYCKTELLSGRVLDFVGLVTIIPDKISSDYKSTLALECYKASRQIGVPPHTVYAIVKAYLEDLLDDIINSRTASIRGIVNIHPIHRDGKLTNIHSAISASFKNSITSSTYISSVRVHTAKSLKYLIGGLEL